MMRRSILLGSLLALLMIVVSTAAQVVRDTPKAAQARKKLQTKITVEYDNTELGEVVEDIQGQVKGLGIRIDTQHGVSKNTKLTLKAKNMSLEKVLDNLFKKAGLGYIVVNERGNAYDGTLLIRQGAERGYPTGAENGKAVAKADDDEDKPPAKGKNGDKKSKAKAEEKTVAKSKPEPKQAAPEDDAEKAERDAAHKLGFAQTLAEDGKIAKAKERLQDILDKYPTTKAAEEAKKLLKKLNEKE
jgi:TolA-binding protein